MSEWPDPQPISTAPQSGKRILGWSHGKWRVWFWFENYGKRKLDPFWRCYEQSVQWNLSSQPEYWVPLPPEDLEVYR